MRTCVSPIESASKRSILAVMRVWGRCVSEVLNSRFPKGQGSYKLDVFENFYRMA